MFELLCPIKKHAIQSPNSLALIDDLDTYTYKQLDQTIDGLCQQLQKKGVQARQRVAFLAPTTFHTLLLIFALSRIQATACPLSVRLPAEQIPIKWQQLRAAYFVDTKNLSITTVESNSKNPYYEKTPLFMLLFTSGSGGHPKMAGLSFENFYYSALGSNLKLSLKPRHRWLMSIPLYHVGGLAILFRCFMSESTIVFSNLILQDAIQYHKISHLSLVPTQLYRLLQPAFSKEVLATLECLLLGGAPLSADLFKKGMDLGLKIFPTYGMTEMSSQITQDFPDKSSSLTCGQVLPFRELKISAEGEILVRGKTLFHGYFSEQEGFVRPLQEGWLATGDIGKYNEQEKLIFLGRKDSMFISGGENIHPEEIEKALCEIPGIVQACVVPISDAEFGHRPVAFIQQENTSYKIDDIKERLKSKLPGYALPVRIEALPDNSELKVSRSFLIEKIAGFSKF